MLNYVYDNSQNSNSNCTKHFFTF